MLLGQHCSMLSTILFGIVTPDCGLIQAQQYCSILLTTRNNVAPTTLLHPVFNNLLQLIIFCRVSEPMSTQLLNSISSRICRQNTQFNMYTTTSKQQEDCTFKDSHPKCFITTHFDKFHREAFARGGESR